MPSRSGAADERIVALYRDGKTLAEIVNITGRARHKVVHTLHQAGLHLGARRADVAPAEMPEKVAKVGHDHRFGHP